MTGLATGGARLILTRSKRLRQLTVLLFYFAQGFPVGLFLYAVPAWMAASGATTVETAAVVGSSMLPWSFKFFHGFIIDRYTFLAMGRRRIWIVAAQFAMVAVLLGAALVSPLPGDIVALSAIGFAANAATTVQDVGIDSLIVDIMEEEERSQASGFMYGAQVIGISAATAVAGWVFANAGFAAGMAASAAVPAIVFVYGSIIRERPGERRMPWSAGEAHPDARAIQVEAWWPLLKSAFLAIIKPLSLLLVPILLFRSLPWGGFEAFHPILFTQTVGWALDSWTSFYATINFITGITGLLLGGFLVAKFGAQRSVTGAAIIGALLLCVMGLNQARWGDEMFAAGFVIAMEFVALFYFIAAIPMAMRMCSPAVAATQFTIYMALGNFGRPLGASIAAATEANPHYMYLISAVVWMAVAGLLLVARFPTVEATPENVPDELPQGEGLSPRLD